MQPRFIETNMNQTRERVIDEATEGHNTMILECFAQGMPRPTVTWYKVYNSFDTRKIKSAALMRIVLFNLQDGVRLGNTSQYLYKYNSQELNIKYLQVHDSGLYSCRANSRIGTAENFQQITVKGGCKFYDLYI